MELVIVFCLCRCTNIEQALKEFNTLQPSIKFTIETEIQETVIFLYLTIYHKNTNLEFSAYRKPTETDIMIYISSCFSRKKKSKTKQNTHTDTQHNKIKWATFILWK
jgi:hypothetical protein